MVVKVVVVGGGEIKKFSISHDNYYGVRLLSAERNPDVGH